MSGRGSGHKLALLGNITTSGAFPRRIAIRMKPEYRCRRAASAEFFFDADMYQYRLYFQMLVWISSLSARRDLSSTAIKRLAMRTKIEHKGTISKTEAIMTDILRDIAAFFSVSLFLASMALIVSSL